MDKLKELQSDFEDQLENIKAIKGDAYAKALSFSITMISGTNSVFGLMFTNPKSLDQALQAILAKDIGQDLCATAMAKYMDALGLVDDEVIKEIATHAREMIKATGERVKAAINI